MPPALRKQPTTSSESVLKVRSAVNKLAEANLPVLLAEVLRHFAANPARGDVLTRAVVREVVAAVAEGAGTTDRFAAVSAVFVGALAARAGYP